MNIKTTKNLIALFALAFLVAGVNQASAYVPGVWDPQPRIPNNEPAFYKVPTTYDAPIVSQGATTYTYTTTPAPKTVVTTTTPPVRNTTTTNSNNTSSNSVNTNNDSRELKPVIIDNGPSNNNGLTALSLQGSGSFMPSSIWQWLLVIFLILVVIIISRMLSKSHTHEVHTVKAH